MSRKRQELIDEAAHGPHGKIRLPDSVDLKIRSQPGERFRISYTETFRVTEARDVMALRLKTSLEAFRALGEKAVTGGQNRSGIWLRIEKTGTRSAIGDFVACEFIAWGRIGQATIKDLLAAIGLAAGKAAKK